MKNRYGFTLIELLATIIIIGIVVLITAPVASNIIKRTKRSTFVRSVESINKISSDYYITNSALVEEAGVVKFICNGKECVFNKDDEDDSKEKLDTKGAPGVGYVKIYTEGEVEISLSNGSYCAIKYPNQDKINIYNNNCDNISIKTFIITFNAGEGVTDTLNKVVINGEIYGTLPVATREGYIFAGWYTALTNGVQVDETTNVSLTNNQILYARWTKTGKEITFGGYKWHILGEYIDNSGRTLQTLLMDAGQISNMNHCTNDADTSTDCGVASGSYQYSWDKSLIRKYLNEEFLNDLRSKVTNEIIPVSICADLYDENGSYGGYLIEEVNDIVGASCDNIVTDYVRLISQSEYWSLSPKYAGENFYYPNISHITRLLNSGDYNSWLYCSSNNCGNDEGYWWSMGYGDLKSSTSIIPSGEMASNLAAGTYGVRPVITIVK